jgi:hypothetical protein
MRHDPLAAIDEEMALLRKLFIAASEGDHPNPSAAALLSQQLLRLRSQYAETARENGQTLSREDVVILARRIVAIVSDLLRDSDEGLAFEIADQVRALIEPDVIPIERRIA